MLERSEASKICYLVISTTIRKRRVVEGFARKNPKTSKGEILPIVRMTNSASHVILSEAKNLKPVPNDIIVLSFNICSKIMSSSYQ